MPVKRCALCKRPAYTSAVLGKKDRKWLCAACQKRFEERVLAGKNQQGGKICLKCKKKNNQQCRFSAYERQRITACSDWEGKNTEHEKRRWAKFEIEQD